MKRGRRGKQHSSPKGSRGVVEGGGAEEVGEHQVGKRSRREEAAAASRAKRNRTELQDAKEAPGAPQQEPAQLAQPQATTQAPKVMGTLVSQSAQLPNLCLKGPHVSVGRGATCHVTLVDPKIPDEAARLQMTSITEGAAVDQVTLECINHVEGFTLNNVQLHVNQPVTLHGGDKISIPSSAAAPFLFEFQPVDGSSQEMSLVASQLLEAINMNDNNMDSAAAPHAAEQLAVGDNMLFVGPGLRSVELHAPTTAAANKEPPGTSVSSLLRQRMHRILHGNAADTQDGGGGFPMQLGARSLSEWIGMMGAANGGSRGDAMPSPAAALQRAMDAAAVPVLPPPTTESAKPNNIASGTAAAGTVDTEAPAASAESAERHAKQVEVFAGEIAAMVSTPGDDTPALDAFPHYLAKGTKQHLLSAAYVHLKQTALAKHTQPLTAMSNKILLTGPFGSDLYQTTLIRALAKQLGAQFLLYDHGALLTDNIQPDENTSDAAVGATDMDDDDDVDMLGDMDDIDKSDIAQLWRSLPSAARSQLPSSRALRAARAKVGGGRAELVVGVTRRGKATVMSFKVGDRVRYVGGMRDAPAPLGGLSAMTGVFCLNPRREARDSKGPWVGLRGKVVVLPEEGSKKNLVGVNFDQVVTGGTSLDKRCDAGHGYYVQPYELRLENSVDRVNEAHGAAIDALFNVIDTTEQPLVVLIKDIDKHMLEDDVYATDRYLQFGKRLDAMQGPVIVIGTSTADARRDRGNFLSGRFGGHPLLDLGFSIDGLPRMDDRNRSETNTKPLRLLSRLLPNRVAVSVPQDDATAREWKSMLEADTATMREHNNRTALRTLLIKCGLECTELDNVVVRDQALSVDGVEKIVGWAMAHSLMAADEKDADRVLSITADDFKAAVEQYRAMQADAHPSKNLLKDVQTDNEFEKRLLSEVIPADEVGVGFDDIGALDDVKRTLREVVMLPLQRPELFAKGSLTKPTKGVLLFGPPGTGKTMLAKAVASESGANFINVSMSSLASKWFGEGEKYVRALFSLAQKIAPSVIFVDEVDSMLGRRDKTGEHEAMRKIKNEFMANWDGLRTCQRSRVLVLAATNRPMDLDEAVVRRMPRRLFVDLPDTSNRERILRIILQSENISADFAFDELATKTDGYSGSDLHNLCVAAAYRPIRDFLKAEGVQAETNAAVDSAAEAKGAATDKPSTAAELRQLSMDDFVAAMEQVGASVSKEALHMNELRQWNESFGEGGSRKTVPLPYFL